MPVVLPDLSRFIITPFVNPGMGAAAMNETAAGFRQDAQRAQQQRQFDARQELEREQLGSQEMRAMAQLAWQREQQRQTLEHERENERGALAEKFGTALMSGVPGAVDLFGPLLKMRGISLTPETAAAAPPLQAPQTQLQEPGTKPETPTALSPGSLSLGPMPGMPEMPTGRLTMSGPGGQSYGMIDQDKIRGDQQEATRAALAPLVAPGNVRPEDVQARRMALSLASSNPMLAANPLKAAEFAQKASTEQEKIEQSGRNAAAISTHQTHGEDLSNDRELRLLLNADRAAVVGPQGLKGLFEQEHAAERTMAMLNPTDPRVRGNAVAMKAAVMNDLKAMQGNRPAAQTLSWVLQSGGFAAEADNIANRVFSGGELSDVHLDMLRQSAAAAYESVRHQREQAAESLRNRIRGNPLILRRLGGNRAARDALAESEYNAALNIDAATGGNGIGDAGEGGGESDSSGMTVKGPPAAGGIDDLLGKYTP